MPDDVPVLEKKPPSETARSIATGLLKRDQSRKDIASLHVRGRNFENWKSVRVEARASQPFPTFQFEASEYTPVPLQRALMQFLPGDKTLIYLGGELAVTGFIDERHTAYDAGQHAIRLMGTGKQRDLVTSTVPPEKLDGHDNQNWLQLARDISSHLGIPIEPKGSVDLKPFQKIGIQPGETIMNVIERYAKMRNIVIGSNHEGALLGIGEHSDIILGELVENYNILRANCVIRDHGLFERIVIRGQNTGGSSGGGGAAENEQDVERQGSATRPKVMMLAAEIADDIGGLARRADMEIVFTEGTEIEANITVQGWFKDNNKSDSIWRANESYLVNSPSLCLNGVKLGCAACVYEQSDAGTTTTLTMVDPIHLNKGVNIRMAVEQRILDRRIEQVIRNRAAEDARTPGSAPIGVGID